MNLRQLWDGWNQFWFAPQSPLPMAVFRIFFGLHVIMFVVLLYPDLATWYGPHGLVSQGANNEWLNGERFSVLNWLPQTMGSVYGVFLLLLITAITTTCGLFTRTSLIVLAVMLFSIHHRNLIILNSGDLFMRLSSLYLLFSHCGDALSVDNLLKKRFGQPPPPSASPGWAQRLVQIQLCMVYAHSFFGKINGETWLSGTALYYVGRLQDFQKLPAPMIFDNILMINLLTWATLIIEFALFTFVWIKDFRYYVLAAGVLLHLGIEWTMNIPLFETQMICAYVVFVDANDLQRVIDRLARFCRISVRTDDRGVELAQPGSMSEGNPFPSSGS